MSVFDTTILPGDVVQQPPPASARRTVTASAMRLDLRGKSTRKEIDRGPTRDRQRAAWEYYDLIGEVKFAFNLLAAIMSRVRLYPAIITSPDEPPVEAKKWLAQIQDSAQEIPEQASELVELMTDVLESLDRDYVAGGLSEMLRQINLNFNIPGEFFFVRPRPGMWAVASIDELSSTQGTGYQLRMSREAKPLQLKKDAYVARVWRAHPRWTREPDSSVLGALEQCEKLVLLDREIRATARTRMHAGMVYIADGIRMSGTEDETEEPLEVTLTKSLAMGIQDEASINTVVPLFLRGPAGLIENGIKVIDLARTYDPQLAQSADRALERLLASIDVPKDLVTGMAGVRYANAVIIDDSLYRAHIEPGALLATDAITSTILRPVLMKAGIPDKLIGRAVIWYDPSSIVTRPDRSAAANEGHDRLILSDEAWRNARGFNDSDAPDMEERLRRIAFGKTQLTPDEGLAIIKHFAPDVFAAIELAAQQSNGNPKSVQDLLNGGNGNNGNNNNNGNGPPNQTTPLPAGQVVPQMTPTPPGPAGTTPAEGGKIAQGGTMPPRQPVP